MSDTKQCKCGKLMIKRSTGTVYPTYPPTYPMYWWCGECGARESAPTEHAKTEDQIAVERWREANKPQPSTPQAVTIMNQSLIRALRRVARSWKDDYSHDPLTCSDITRVLEQLADELQEPQP